MATPKRGARRRLARFGLGLAALLFSTLGPAAEYRNPSKPVGAGGTGSTLATPAGATESEPNDGFGDAEPIGCPSVEDGAIDPKGDVDYYRLSGTPGFVVTLDVDVSGSLDSVLGAFDSSLTLVAYSDDNEAPGEGFSVESYLEVVLPADGLLYVAVSAFRDIGFVGADTGTSGAYSLVVGCGAGSGEPNDGFGSASLIGCGSVLDFSISSVGDVDYYLLNGVAGLNVGIDIDADETGSGLNSILGVYDRLFQRIALSDDDAAPGESPTEDSYLEVALPQEELMFIAVSASPDDDFDGSGGATSGPYSLSIACSVEPDEPNQVFAQATLVECGEVKQTFISPKTDVDYYRMIGVPGSTVSVDIDAFLIGSTLDSVLGIFDSSLGEIGFSDDDSAQGEGTSTESYLEVTVPADGVMYIAVSSFSDNDFDGGGSDTTGFYTMLVDCTAEPCSAALSLGETDSECALSSPLMLSLQNPDCPITEVSATIEDLPDWVTGVGCTIDPALAADFTCMFTDNGTSLDLTIDSASAGEIPQGGTKPIATVSFTGNASCLDDCATSIALDVTPAVFDDAGVPVSTAVTDGSLTMCTCGERGDSSCDDTPCDLFDIIETIDQALGESPDSCEADVDCSCGVNIFDVLCLIDCTLDAPTSCLLFPCPYTGCLDSGCSALLAAESTGPVTPDQVAPVVLRLNEAGPVTRGRASASVELEAVSGPIDGLSLSVHVPAPWKVTQIESADPFSAVEPYFYQNGEVLRIVLVMPDGTAVATQNGPLLELSLSRDDQSRRSRRPELHLLEAEAAGSDGGPLDLHIVNGGRSERRTGRSQD